MNGKDFEFLILEKLYSSPQREIDQSKLFNLDKSSINEIYTALKDLVDSKWIKRITGSTKYKLTSSGVAAYKQLKQERNQDSEKKRQQRFDNKISIASILIKLITFILGLLVEHYAGLVEFLIKLFS